jgi:serine/threonine protein kinase
VVGERTEGSAPRQPQGPEVCDLPVPPEYKFIDLIARTARSVVMRVVDQRTGQAAVLKRSARPTAAPLDIAALGVRCPGILLPCKSWVEGDVAYELLDWVEGFTLESIMEHARAPIRGKLLDYWVTTLVEYLVPLHTAAPPIIHRDITPANVVVSTPDLNLVLIDTSSACLLGQPQEPVGSPSYAPLEQLLGNAVPASDLYALGALAYHLAMGRLPPSFHSRQQAAKRGGTESLRIDTGLEKLQGWLATMLALDPRERPLNADVALERKRAEPTLHGDDWVETFELPNGTGVTMGSLSFRVESG